MKHSKVLLSGIQFAAVTACAQTTEVTGALCRMRKQACSRGLIMNLAMYFQEISLSKPAIRKMV